MPVWGLGETLYVPNGTGSYVIGHDGNNYPAINTTARIDPATGDGIVVLESGNGTLASEIGGEWVFWHTGTVGLDTLAILDARSILIQLVVRHACHLDRCQPDRVARTSTRRLTPDVRDLRCLEAATIAGRISPLPASDGRSRKGHNTYSPTPDQPPGFPRAKGGGNRYPVPLFLWNSITSPCAAFTSATCFSPSAAR